MASSPSLQPINIQDVTDEDANFDIPDSQPAPPPVTNNSTTSAVDDAEIDEDWDIEMDLGKTGGAKALPSPPPNTSNATFLSAMNAPSNGYSGVVTRLGGNVKSDVEESWDEFDLDFMSSDEASKTDAAPSNFVPHTKVAADLSDWDDDDDAVPTIKANPGQLSLPTKPRTSTPPKKIATVADDDDDFEEDFSLPDDLSHLSLRPLKHRSSKTNLDAWGDHNTSSSTAYSSEASSFGCGPQDSSSSNSTSAFSHAETESEDDDESVLDGLILPEGLFDSDKNSRQLHKVIEDRKKAAALEVPVTIASPQEDDDFESGLVIDDDVDFNLSKVKQHRLSQSTPRSSKALSMQTPPRPSLVADTPPPRAQSFSGKPDPIEHSVQRSKSPLGRTFASVARDPPIRGSGSISPTSFRSPTARTRAARSSFHEPSRPMVSPPPPSSFTGTPSQLGAAKEALKRQTSAGKLHGSSQIGGTEAQRRAIVRKASLSSIDVSSVSSGGAIRVTLKRPTPRVDTEFPQAPQPSLQKSPGLPTPVGRFNSSARTQSMHSPLSPATIFALSSSMSRLQQSPNLVPPTPPGTPSSNPVALRLTTATSTARAKPRPSLAGVFPSTTAPARPTSFAAAVKSPPRTPAKSPLSVTTVNALHATPPTTAITTSPRTRLTITRTSTLSAVTSVIPHPPQAKILKRPKRLRAYGDGTELDGIEDLPTDRDREGKYRVIPKGYSSGGKVTRRTSGAGRSQSGDFDAPSETGSPVTGISSIIKSIERRRADLSSNRASVSSSATVTPSLGRSTLSPLSSPKTGIEKRKSMNGPPLKRRPMLIRNLNGAGQAKVVGEMRWNPQTLRWEGNDQVLRDFDNAISSSSRPALITQLSGSALGSPVTNSAGAPTGARVVGNMLFDPIKMCWVSQLPPEEDEPDPFANMADDEDDDSWEKNKGGTIRASSLANFLASTSPTSDISDRPRPARSRAGSSLLVIGVEGDGLPSPSHSTHSKSQSEMESGSERGSRMQDEVNLGIVSDQLQEDTTKAEPRHLLEMKGWMVASMSSSIPSPSPNPDEEMTPNPNIPETLTFPPLGAGGDVIHSEMDRSFHFELKAIASKRY